jgi:hypothetical protein
VRDGEWTRLRPLQGGGTKQPWSAPPPEVSPRTARVGGGRAVLRSAHTPRASCCSPYAAPLAMEVSRTSTSMCTSCWPEGSEGRNSGQVVL